MVNELTDLCALAYQYGTDKCPQIKHTYTPFYYELFNSKRFSIKKVLEVGIGQKRKNKAGGREDQPYLLRGASLYMWRDFFPNAQIFGADLVPDTLFEDERIKTYLCDERKEEDIIALIKTIGSDIDIVIDDGSHRLANQVFLAKTLLPLLKKDVTYIIEDVGHSRYLRKVLGESGSYEYEVPDIIGRCRGNMLLIVRNKLAGKYE